MSDLLKKAREKLAFDGLPLVAAEAEVVKHFEPGPYTIENTPKEMHAFGFYAGAAYERARAKPIIEALLKVAEVAGQGVDGKTRLVVPGDSWHERMAKALSDLRKKLEDV